MKKTFKQLSVNGYKFNFLNLPNTNLFRFEIINLMGSNIERVIYNTENKNIFGLSHFIEHLSFKSTKDYTSEEILNLLKTEGFYNASTDHDRINYWFKTIMSKMDIAISLVCNYALNDLSKLNEAEFEIEKKVVFNEAKRYADDDQTMFYFNCPSAVSDYHKEDNVIGIPETISSFMLSDAIEIKRKFLSCGQHVFNIVYDAELCSEEQIINKILSQVSRFLPVDINNNVDLITNYNSMLNYPKVGTFLIPNEADQVMTSIIMDVVGNVITTKLGNDYLGYFSETSLDDIIREKNGLTYGTSLYNTRFSYKPYTVFGCDVSKGTEQTMLSLFNESIIQSVAMFNEETYKKLLDTAMLRNTLNAVNLESFQYIISLAVCDSEVLNEYFETDIIDGIAKMTNEHWTFEKINEYLTNVKNVVVNKNYSLITNIN